MNLIIANSLAYLVQTNSLVSTNFTPLGEHLINVEGDSVLFVTRGMMTLQDMQQLLHVFADVHKKHAQLYVFYDSRGSTGMEPAARRLGTSEESAKVAAGLQVSFGAPFSMRIMMTLFNRASVLLGKPDAIVHVFATETEARAYFNAERDRMRAAFASKFAAAS